jgi:hypothetical protein
LSTTPGEGRRPAGLNDGETIVAMQRVRFSAGLPADVASSGKTTLRPPSLIQRHAYALWARRGAAAGFPIAGPEMMLGITQTRMLAWRPALIRSRPRRFAGAIPLARINSAGVHRKLFSSVLTMLLDDGAIVGVETVHSAALRRFASAIPTYTDHRAR